MRYADFLAGKSKYAVACGSDVTAPRGAVLWDWQRTTVDWALGMGRAALFEDTGLGKTRQQLAWARALVDLTDRPALVLAPLGVVRQTSREARAAGISLDGITVANYEQLHNLKTSAFGSVVLDESSILKNYSGTTRRRLQAAFSKTPFRLCCTATPAPNDFLELGTHAEFLGVMSSHEMIARWFITDQSEFGKYRLKGHAVRSFWRWVTSWARCIGRPSDMGRQYSDAGYDLPALHEHRHTVEVDIIDGRGDGLLFRVPDLSATSIHREKRRTAEQRAARVAELVKAELDEAWVVWCDTNYEADALTAVLPTAIDVRGSMSPQVKADLLERFATEGGVIVTKPSIAGMGLNWQHAARMAFVGGTYSYEQYYQSVRRCWRFGQERPVHVHVVMAATELALWNVMARKRDDHERMKLAMFAASREAAGRAAQLVGYEPTYEAEVPAWIQSLV